MRKTKFSPRTCNRIAKRRSKRKSKLLIVGETKIANESSGRTKQDGVRIELRNGDRAIKLRPFDFLFAAASCRRNRRPIFDVYKQTKITLSARLRR